MPPSNRRHQTSKVMKAQDVGGLLVMMYVVDDPDDEGLQLSMTKYLAEEDYEYCSELQQEANRRGLKLKY